MADVTLGDLRAALSGAAAGLSGGVDARADMARVTEAAVLAVHGCEHASITLVVDGRPSTPAASSTQARLLDQAQYDCGEGPCLSAVRERQVVSAPDVRSDARWPALRASRLREAQVRSVLSVPMTMGEEVVGALNFSSSATAAFHARAQDAARVVSHYATAVVVAGRRRPYRAQPVPEPGGPRLEDPAPQAATALAEALRALAGGDVDVRLPQDPSPLGEACTAFNQLAEALQVREASLDAFLAQTAGPLRDGLTVVATGADLLAGRRARLDHTGQQALDLVLAELGWLTSVALEVLRLPQHLADGEPARLPPR